MKDGEFAIYLGKEYSAGETQEGKIVLRSTDIEDVKNGFEPCKPFNIKYIEDKINILKDEAGVYNILFINRNGKKYLIERDRKVPDIFEKFYREVLYYRDIMKQIVEYEKVFNDKIEYKTKIRMLGY